VVVGAHQRLPALLAQGEMVAHLAVVAEAVAHRRTA
jgi:hypothetical protein